MIHFCHITHCKFIILQSFNTCPVLSCQNLVFTICTGTGVILPLLTVNIYLQEFGGDPVTASVVTDKGAQIPTRLTDMADGTYEIRDMGRQLTERVPQPVD